MSSQQQTPDDETRPGGQHRHGEQAPAGDPAQDPREFWEARYGGDQVWSGKVNATMAAIVESLPAPAATGRALDLGCGEGGDVIHLAEAGWDATGIDLSEAAVARASAAAQARGVADRARFIAADLTDPSASWGDDDGGFDLVTASFFQSPVALDRAVALRRAASLLNPGGHLVLVSHGAAPAWAPEEVKKLGDFPSPASELQILGFPPPATTPGRCSRRSCASARPPGRTVSPGSWRTPCWCCGGADRSAHPQRVNGSGWCALNWCPRR